MVLLWKKLVTNANFTGNYSPGLKLNKLCKSKEKTMSYDTVHGGAVFVTRIAQTSLANICTTDHILLLMSPRN